MSDKPDWEYLYRQDEKRIAELEDDLAALQEDYRQLSLDAAARHAERDKAHAELAHANDLLTRAVEVNGHIGEDWMRDKETLAIREAELAALEARLDQLLHLWQMRVDNCADTPRGEGHAAGWEGAINDLRVARKETP